jgi:hypothetical protein
VILGDDAGLDQSNRLFSTSTIVAQRRQLLRF